MSDFVLTAFLKPSLSGPCSSCPRFEDMLTWSSSIWVAQIWLGPGMFVVEVLLVGVSVSGITVGDKGVLLG